MTSSRKEYMRQYNFNRREKMKKYLNFPLLILSAFIVRPLLHGAGLGDALVIIGLSALYGAYYYLDLKREPSPYPHFH